MKNVGFYFLLAVLFVSALQAQTLAERLPALDDSSAFEFTSTDQLLEEGWTEAEPGLWTQTLEDGVKAEFALGRAAFERIRDRIDNQIAALQANKNLDARQEIQLLELLLRRGELVREEGQLKSNPAKILCTGSAFFSHDFSYINFAYPFVSSMASFSRTSSAGTATTYTSVGLCGSSTCSFSENESLTGMPVFANAGGIPTWTCTADAYSSVILGGNLPTQCQRFAFYSTSWSC